MSICVRCVGDTMGLHRRNFEGVAGCQQARLTGVFDFELPFDEVEQLSGTGVIVHHFSESGRDPFLNDGKIPSTQKPPSVATASPV